MWTNIKGGAVIIPGLFDSTAELYITSKIGSWVLWDIIASYCRHVLYALVMLLTVSQGKQENHVGDLTSSANLEDSPETSKIHNHLPKSTRECRLALCDAERNRTK